MSIGAELGQYILQTHNFKNLTIQWRGFEPPNPSTCGYASGCTNSEPRSACDNCGFSDWKL